MSALGVTPRDPANREVVEASEIINFSARMTAELLQAGKTSEEAFAEVMRLSREKWPHLWSVS